MTGLWYYIMNFTERSTVNGIGFAARSSPYFNSCLVGCHHLPLAFRLHTFVVYIIIRFGSHEGWSHVMDHSSPWVQWMGQGISTSQRGQIQPVSPSVLLSTLNLVCSYAPELLQIPWSTLKNFLAYSYTQRLNYMLSWRSSFPLNVAIHCPDTLSIEQDR
jgi:hypothetical protein